MALDQDSPNNTYTELNKGVNGSKMDESSVVQQDPTTLQETTVHRERVVLGLDTGELIGIQNRGDVDLPVNDRLGFQLQERMVQQLDTIIELLMKMVG